MLQYIKRFFSQKSTRILTSADLNALLRGNADSSSGVPVSERSAMQVAAVYACVKVISESLAQLPLNVKQQAGKGSRYHDADGLAELLHYQPNSWQTSFEFRELAQTLICLRGNFYAFINRQRGKVVELLPIFEAEPVTTKHGEILSYKAEFGGKKVDIPFADMLHIRGQSLDGVTGVSPITAQRETIGLALAAQRHGSATYKNGGRPGGVLTTPEAISDETRGRISEAWAKAHGGGNQGGTAILEAGLSYTPITITAEDAQYIETRQFSRSEIASIYRVPPHLIADLTKSSFSNIEQQSMEFVKYTLLPWVKRWEQAGRRDLLSESQRKAKLYLDFNLTALERADLKTRTESYQREIQNGTLSPNEARELEGRNPREGGDIYLTPMNMTTDPESVSKPDGTVKFKSTADDIWVLVEKYQPKLQEAIKGLVANEIDDIKNAMVKLEVKDTGFLYWLDQYYRDFDDRVERSTIPAAMREFGNAVIKQVTVNYDISPDQHQELKHFVAEYIAGYKGRYSQRSKMQLRSIIIGFETHGIKEVVLERLGEWKEKKALKESTNEATRLANAVARETWVKGGVTRFQWQIRGASTCPFCTQLNGRIVGVEQPFMHLSDVLYAQDDNGNWSALKATSNYFHPPIHRGCDCAIVPR